MPGRIGLVNEHGRVHEIQREGCRHGFSLSKTERRRIVKGRKIRKKSSVSGLASCRLSKAG